MRECKAFAEKNDIQIVETYIDRALSARTDRRPDFQRMIKDSAGRKFEVVIVWKPDRLVGYLKFNDSECAFEFNDDDFTLSLYPPTTKDYDIHSILKVLPDLTIKSINGLKI